MLAVKTVILGYGVVLPLMGQIPRARYFFKKVAIVTPPIAFDVVGICSSGH